MVRPSEFFPLVHGRIPWSCAGFRCAAKNISTKFAQHAYARRVEFAKTVFNSKSSGLDHACSDHHGVCAERLADDACLGRQRRVSNSDWIRWGDCCGLLCNYRFRLPATVPILEPRKTSCPGGCLVGGILFSFDNGGRAFLLELRAILWLTRCWLVRRGCDRSAYRNSDFLHLVFTIRWNNREDAIKVNPNKASLFSKFALFVENSLLLVTICFFVYSIGWGARHFVFPGSYGDPTILQTSLAMKKQVARVCSRDGLIDHESLSGDEDLLELKNRLSGASVPPDQNAIYQIAGLSNLEFLDGKGDGQEYRLALGFSRKQIENLPDTQLILWLNQQRPDFVDNDVSPEKQWVWDSTLKNENQIRDFLQNATNREIAYLMHYANWNAAELPIATQYCKEMQSVFQAIRLATRCQFAFSPVSLHADNTDEFVRFAHEMLVIDSHYQVGIGNLDRVIENCESLFRFSELLSKEAPIVARSPIPVLSRMRGDALSVAQRALTHKSCTRSQAERIRGLLNQEIDYAQLSERSNILNFAYWNCEAGNRLRNGSSSDFVLNFHFYGMVEFPFLRTYFHQPQMIDWGEFTQVGIEVLENHADFLRSTNFGLSDVKALDVYVEKLNSPLDEDTPTDSAIAFALGPKTKGRQLGLWAGRSCSAGLLDAEFSYVLRNRIRRAKIAILVEKKMRGRLPGDLSQFLSEDSDGLFLDPYSGKELIYGEDKASDVGFTIYSVGRNGVDDGGQGGDVTLAYSDFAPSTIDYLKTEF